MTFVLPPGASYSPEPIAPLFHHFTIFRTPPAARDDGSK